MPSLTLQIFCTDGMQFLCINFSNKTVKMKDLKQNFLKNLATGLLRFRAQHQKYSKIFSRIVDKFFCQTCITIFRKQGSNL